MDTSARFVFRLLAIFALSLLSVAITLGDSVSARPEMAPFHAMQDLGDFDNDGLPNHADPDDDNDGVEDELDPEPFNADVWEIADPVEEPSLTPTPEPTEQLPETPPAPTAAPDDEVIVAEPTADVEQAAPVQVNSLPDTGVGSDEPFTGSLLFFSFIATGGMLAMILMESGRRKRSM